MPFDEVALPFARVSLPFGTSSGAYRQQTDGDQLPTDLLFILEDSLNA